jgi:hypothetical protein
MDDRLLTRENGRLAQQNLKLQEIIATLRDEIADANAEIAASRRLFEEQKLVLVQELDRERMWRESLARHIEQQKTRSSSVSIGCNTDKISTLTSQTMTDLPKPLYTDRLRPITSIPEAMRRNRNRDFSALQDFADWLSRSSNYHHRDLFSLFESLGATSVEEVCANITESDLVTFGVPLIKARIIMHLIMEQTEALLRNA